MLLYMFRTLLISTFIASLATAGPNAIHTNEVGEGWVDSISNNGVAAGANSGVNQYFMWTEATGNQFIGGVSPGNNVGGQAGVNDNGTFICGSMLNFLTGNHEAGFYGVQSETWTPLGGIGGSSGNSVSSGWGISGDGSTVVGLAWEDAGTAYATTWSIFGNPTSLGSSVKGSSTRANGTNEDGSVVVGWQDTAYRQGAVWINGKQQLIYRPDGIEAFEASAVSSDGRWVTGLGIGSFFGSGDTYRYNTITNVCEVIPNLSVGAEMYMAGADITEDGQTIVGGSWPFGTPAYFGSAFIWRDGIGTVTIENYLDEVGVTFPSNFNFAFATSISPNGKWIAGWGNSGSPGNTVSWFAEIPGEDECPDINGDDYVDVGDLLAVIDQWGQSNSPADINGDGIVNVTDLLEVVGNWGPCA